jgi:aspartate dehydrogenase
MNLPSPENPIRVGILGCGNIATILSRHNLNIRVSAVFDQQPDRAAHLASIWNARRCTQFEEFVSADVDVIVEAASIKAVRDYGSKILRHGKDLIVLSVGALADKTLKNQLTTVAREQRRTIRIPSGALFGLDNAKVARVSPLSRVLLRSTKSPASLGIETTEKQCLFKGPASQAIEAYPKNINVAVALSLATGQEAQVEIWADPAATRNSHEILLSGEFGESEIKVANLPCPDNPATSYLAALSIVTLLNDLDNVLIVGT